MLTAILFGSLLAMSAQNPKVPVPSQRQLEWQKLQYYAFVHFCPNTFLNQEWGKGTEDPNVFNPTDYDARQWVKVFKEAGMTQVIITAKHHDGFCLWPSKYSTHTVAQSKWKQGKGDVLADVRKACDEFGLKMGVYLSPWDRNHPKYGTPAYNQVFADTLKEVLTKYGPIYEVWFDGANGEGPNGKKQVYDWNLFNSTVRKYAPQAVIFSDAGPDIRWVGNESGIAPETSWSTIHGDRYVPGTPLYRELGEGQEDGDAWRPSECDVSIRPGWFYHKDQDDKVKTPEQLMDLYLKSVGRNSALLLNVPPDTRGRIHENDVKSLMGFKSLLDDLWNGHSAKRKSGTLTKRADEWSETFDATSPVDRIILREDIKAGQRVQEFVVEEVRSGKGANVIAKGTTIGALRILPISPIQNTKLRVRITKSRGPANVHITARGTESAAVDLEVKNLQANKDQRMAWWREARFGMFIHWGLYSIPAGEWKGKNYPGASEWLLNTAKIPIADYQPLINQFNPVKYDPKKWVQIAKDAGMKYIVITSKHHDGFALWDSKLSTWDVGSTPYRKDLLKPLADACRKAGIKLGFYHSIMDWSHPDYAVRREWDLRPETPTNMDRYVKFMKGQLKELLTNYGDVAVVWFDGEWEPAAWTHERGKDLYAYVRGLQPKTIVNNRVDVFRSGMAGLNSNDKAAGDFGTPEQEIPASGLPGMDWESCMTFNGSWGYHKNDHEWKSAETIVKNLIDCASKGGNYLLNVGPTELGEIPKPSVDRLARVGDWLSRHGEAIYGTSAGPFPRPLKWGRVTARPGVLYCHVFDPKTTSIELTGFEGKIKRIGLVGAEGAGSLMMGYGPDGPRLPVPEAEDDDPLKAFPRVLAVEVEAGYSVKAVLAKPDSSGRLLLAAVDAKVNGSTARYEDRDDRQCIGFWTDVRDTVSWEFEIESPGEYNVSAMVAASSDSAGATFEVTVHGAKVIGRVPATKSWGDFVAVDLGKLAIVTPGKHIVTVKPLTKPGEAVMNLRSVTLKRR